MNRDDLIAERLENRAKLEKDLAPIRQRQQKAEAEVAELERPRKELEKANDEASIVIGHSRTRDTEFAKQLEQAVPPAWHAAVAAVKAAAAACETEANRLAGQRVEETRRQREQRYAAIVKARDEQLAALERLSANIEYKKMNASDAEMATIFQDVMTELATVGVLQYGGTTTTAVVGVSDDREAVLVP